MAQKAVRKAGDPQKATGDQILGNAQGQAQSQSSKPLGLAGGFFKNGLPWLVSHAAIFSQRHLSRPSVPLQGLSQRHKAKVGVDQTGARGRLFWGSGWGGVVLAKPQVPTRWQQRVPTSSRALERAEEPA